MVKIGSGGCTRQVTPLLLRKVRLVSRDEAPAPASESLTRTRSFFWVQCYFPGASLPDSPHPSLLPIPGTQCLPAALPWCPHLLGGILSSPERFDELTVFTR